MENFDSFSEPNVHEPKTSLFHQATTKNLKLQIQKLSLDNEKYRESITNIEQEKDRFYNEKIRQLLATNSNLEKSLEACNRQIQRIFEMNRTNTEGFEQKMLREEVLALERHNQRQILEMQEKMEMERQEFGAASEKFKCQIQELEGDLHKRIFCIEELKGKISEQQVEIQNNSDKDARLVNLSRNQEAEIESLKRMENWYRTELHEVQSEKTKIMEEVIEMKKELVLQEAVMESLKMKAASLPPKNYSDVKALEVLGRNRSFTDIEKVIKSYQDIFSDLQRNLSESRDESEALRVENHNLKEAIKAKEEALKLQEQNVEQEKKEMESSVQNFKNQFSIFTKKYNSISLELQNKENKIRQLEGEKEQLEQRRTNKRKLQEKFEQVQNKYRIIAGKVKKTEECYKSQSGFKEEAEYLKILVAVQKRDKEEHRKRYHKNYHLLLKKIKEMRTEKKQVEVMCDELKVEMDVREQCLSENKILLDTRSSQIQTLSIEVEKLRDELKSREAKEAEVESIYIEEFRTKLEFQEDLIQKISILNSDIEWLGKKEESTKVELETMKEKNGILLKKIETLEELLLQQRDLNQEFKSKEKDREEKILELTKENKVIGVLEEKNSHYESELKYWKLCVEHKSKEIEEVHRSYNAKKMKGLIVGLLEQIKTMKSEMEDTKKEKYFLQRLCNDLKIVLEIQLDHNKVLKSYLNNIVKAKDQTTKLDLTKCDDISFDKLLAESGEEQDFLEGYFRGIKDDISKLQILIKGKNMKMR